MVVRLFGVDTVEVATQPVYGRGDGELSAPQRLDEVATLAPAGILERTEHLVERREPARHTLGSNCVFGQHAVAVQQQLGLVMGAQRGVRFGKRQRGPPPSDGRVSVAGLGVREAVSAQARRSMPAVCGSSTLPGARPAEYRAYRCERVAGHSSGPNQFPQSGFEFRLGQAVVGQLAEEVRAASAQAG
ncbi:Uncharacterised protein [Mycobacterium tuberculosis]|nr:Uncharacterised protein [Mycobacterium tuberculosis]CNN23486.1 Uncharacterised protein [Mycobacterium tuberculosis]CNN48113.1 Uncharacterised protein [Mycobacterium tuberculosis]CNN64038.1 Uncharacterised protein [Mycobacterium tuberculosis]